METLRRPLAIGLLAAGLMGAGCANDRHMGGTGSGPMIDDRTLEARVSRGLDDHPDYKFDLVNVQVTRGTVQLSGFVNTSTQRNQAGDIAAAVPGVDRVANNITIKPDAANR